MSSTAVQGDPITTQRDESKPIHKRDYDISSSESEIYSFVLLQKRNISVPCNYILKVLTSASFVERRFLRRRRPGRRAFSSAAQDKAAGEHRVELPLE